jgi:hypothetical protein
LNRNQITASSPASEPTERHSPLYRREKLVEAVRREDMRDLCYSRELIDDRYDRDLELMGFGVDSLGVSC